MENKDSVTPDDALATLQGLNSARQRIADRLTSPWWYRLGAALCTASLFVGTGLVVGVADPSRSTETWSSLLVVLGAVVAPFALLSGLKRSTGVSVDRYAQGLGAWYAVVFTLFAVAFALQQFAGVAHALTVAGAGAFLATLLTERHIDALLVDRVRAAGGHA